MLSSAAFVLLLVIVGDVAAKSLVAVTTLEPDTTDSSQALTDPQEVEEWIREAAEAASDDPDSKKRPKVLSLVIDSDIRSRYARTQVSSRIGNPDLKSAQEVTFTVVLPDTAFISAFVLEVDGKSYDAYVAEKVAAKKTYDDAVQQGQTAGHVAVSARDSNMFTVSVNVGSGKKVGFKLTYEELLARRRGLYEQVITVDPGQPVAELRLKACVQETANITQLKVPALRDNAENDVTNTENKLARVEMLSPTHACIHFAPSKKQQLDNYSQKGVSGQFLIQYDVERELDAGEVLVVDGYFVHFFAPSQLPPLRKHVVFVLDTSGSMWGRKIEQLREAMTTILSDLREDDYFNIIQFSSGVTVWYPALEAPARDSHYWEPPSNLDNHSMEAYPANAENVAKAKKYVESMQASGGTNIHDALLESLKFTEKRLENGSVEPLLVFLTDGEPTVGVTNPDQITSKVTDTNAGGQVALFSLAFGTGADFSFLKRLSLKNQGFARKIYEASDAHLQLGGFYQEIASPLLANVTFKYLEDQVDTTSLTRSRFPTYFGGSELVVAGKLNSDSNDLNIEAFVSGMSADGDLELSVVRAPPACFFYPELALPASEDNDEATPTSAPYSDDAAAASPSILRYPVCPPIIIPPTMEPTPEPTQAQKFVERLWAYLTIHQLLEKDISEDKDEKPSEPSTTTVPTTTSTVAAEEPSTKSSTVASPPKPPAIVVKVKKETPKEKALRLALHYGFVTPLTSLVVVKPNETESKAVDAKPVSEDDFNSFNAQDRIVSGSSLQSFSKVGTVTYQESALVVGGGGGGAGGIYHGAPGSPGAARPASFPQMIRPTYRPPYTTTRIYYSTSRPTTTVTTTTVSTTTVAEEDSTEAVKNLTLDDITWLQDHLENDLLVLPGNITYKLGNHLPDLPYEDCTTPSGAEGYCRHLHACVQSEFVSDFQVFQEYFCPIAAEYAGVCCPKSDELEGTPVESR